MNIEVHTTLNQNITIVYDTLVPQTIDSSELKKLMGTQTKPVVMDTPEMVVAVYPPEPTVIQIGDNRIRITLAPNKDIGSVPLWEVASRCHQLVPKSKSKLVAYGFNYDVIAMLASGNAYQTTTDLFISDSTMFENVLEGRLLSFIPRIRFERLQALYDLVLEPIDEQHIKAHLNVHFSSVEIVLPPNDQLQNAFYEQYENLCSILYSLFRGGS